MIKFEKRFLYTFADVEEAKKLIGKKGLFSDMRIFESDLLCDSLLTLENVIDNDELPFKTKHCAYRFFYYDPYLIFKRAYFLEGKTLQRKLSDG